MSDPPAPEQALGTYAAFIQAVELRNIWLLGAEIQNLAGPEQPEHIWVKVDDGEPSKQLFEDRFVVIKPFRVRFEGVGGELQGDIIATFGLEYSSSVQMTESAWNIFAAHNVPLNVWPYFREFVSNVTGRMGWTNLTIPTYKVIPNQASANDAAQSDDAERST